MKFRQVVLLPALLALAFTFAFAQTSGQPERFTATAVSTSPQYGTGAQTVEINVNRWSPPSDRERLVASLMKSPDELLKQLQKTKPVLSSDGSATKKL